MVSVVHGFFENMRGAVDSKLLEKANQRACSALQQSFEQAEAEYESILREMNVLEEEAIKALAGHSKLDMDTIKVLIPKCKARLDGAKVHMEDLQKKLEQEENSTSTQTERLQEILTWADVFDHVNTATKHMILSKLIEKIVVGKDGRLHIKFRLTAKQYLGEQPEDITCTPKKVS